MTEPMTELAGTRMGRRLTAPWERGADVLDLTLRPGADAATVDVAAYTFDDHTARFGRAPRPAYVLRTLRDVAAATTVHVTVSGASGDRDVTVAVPAGALAGQSFVVRLPEDAGPDPRLRRLRVDPAGSDPAALWAVTALLGTTAKLLWTIGWERDNLRRHADLTVAQRRLDSAIGPSLDLIGTDLAVPRFPPLPYRFDPDTVALYHCDDLAGASVAVEDFTARFPGRVPHHGALAGDAAPGAPGRFGTGIALPSASAVVRIASGTDFDVPANRGLTVECFVRPTVDSADGRVIARRTGTGAGWEIAVGEFGRGLPRTVRVRISNGATTVEVFGDSTLPVDNFTHVALVFAGGTTLALWQDGRLVARAEVAPLGAIASTAPVEIGPAGTGFRGIVDEVRISAVARTHFSPVLGEDDGHYRRRLGLFRRWVLPAPHRLEALLNGIVGRVGGHENPLVVDDTDADLVRGSTFVRVVPARLLPGESIDGTGRRRVTESDIYDPDGDQGFDAALLSRHERSDVTYTTSRPATSAPGRPAADVHLVQRSVFEALDRLVELTAPAAAGPVIVDRAFDLEGPAGHPTGRAVVLRHTGLPPARLAALAHRAGFDFVARPPRGGAVYCSCAPGRLIALAVPAEVVVEKAVAVTVEPTLPRDATVHYRLIPHGTGRARIVTGADGATTVVGERPGQVVVVADVARGGRTISSTATVAVRPKPLAEGATIAADGRQGVDESVVGPPAPTFDPRLLAVHDDDRVDYGQGPAAQTNQRMQPGVARRLTALLDRINIMISGVLQVTAGFDPTVGPATLARQGRALTIRHLIMDAGSVAAAAHAVGFGFVRRSGDDVLLRHAEEPLLAIDGPPVIEEGAAATFTVRPDPATLPDTLRLSWSAGGVGAGRVALTSTTQPTGRIVGAHAGTCWVQATLHDANALATHQVEVRLRPAVTAGNATLTLDQYDLIMNTLHALHPIGVEFVTRRLREAVVELADDGERIDPRFTYPRFRLHRSTARLVIPPRQTGG